MVIIRMTGGLGNQMFQYALYLKLLSQGKEVKFDDVSEYLLENARPIMLWTFGIEYPKASEYEIDKITDGFLKLSHRIRRKIFGRKGFKYEEKSCNFDAEVLEKDPAYLTGYFQSEKYFKEVEKQVREQFVFSEEAQKNVPEELKNKIRIYQTDIQKDLAVSLHIRRGDYLDNHEVYGGICTGEYYEAAITLIKQKYPAAVFYVFSNDDAWAKEWCGMQEEKYQSRFVSVTGVTEEMGYLDMHLMSKCKHHIIANSSFSWWGAYLNPDKEKCVVAPAKWFNNQDCRDIYTENMIRITSEGEVTGT